MQFNSSTYFARESESGRFGGQPGNLLSIGPTFATVLLKMSNKKVTTTG